ncbi:c-type cytochrome [Neisseria bacilliformis]|uniref:c-type cytochrome n=1 Tax=Neisseria bacilliformis TaxID=267212 RepID=UPI0006683F74|nr:c-type cytochrome [Neisseria bacilliformis]
MKRLTLLTLALAGGAAFAAPKADVAKGKQIAQKVCAACHAADGNSGISTYPKLSAQHARYLAVQTAAIKEGKRTTGGAAAMKPMVMSLSEQDIADVAAFYATQTPKSGEANPKDNLKLGAQIFRGGIADKKLPACMSCHGPSGAGIPAAGTDVTAYPRLGGQHKDYTVTQIKAYTAGQRTSPNGMMEEIAKRMSEDEINAVANFIQGLH